MKVFWTISQLMTIHRSHHLNVLPHLKIMKVCKMSELHFRLVSIKNC